MKELLNPKSFQVFKPDWEQNFNLHVRFSTSNKVSRAYLLFSRANVKTVAIGAVRHHLYKNVAARVSPYSYGVLGDVVYEPSNAEHKSRSDLVYTSATSGKLIGPTFSCIAKKVLERFTCILICAERL